MNTTNPGIFIPLIHSFSELVYIDSPAEYQKLFAVAQEKISAALQETSVEHFVFPACRICLDDKTGQPDFYQGLSVFLRRPHQIEYVKAMPATKKLWLILTFLRKTLTPSRCKMFRLRASDRFQNPFFAR